MERSLLKCGLSWTEDSARDPNIHKAYRVLEAVSRTDAGSGMTYHR